MSSSDRRLPSDIADFIAGYPGQRDDRSLNANAEFYADRAPALPTKMVWHELIERLEGDWDEMER